MSLKLINDILMKLNKYSYKNQEEALMLLCTTGQSGFLK